MLQQFIVFGCMLQMAFAAPQFVTFKDGKVGVNFAGYHAEAGLGGLLTGNAAHGGLSASAGTPWGPQAAAGLNGALDGRAVGNAYAGAQYSPEVGASSVIGGTAGQQGFAGAEAHSHGKVSSKTISSQAVGLNANYVPQQTEEVATSAPQTTNIQKIKPPKKYSVLRHEYPNNRINQYDDIESSDSKTINRTVSRTRLTTVAATGRRQAPKVTAATAEAIAAPATAANITVINRQRKQELQRQQQQRRQEHQQRRQQQHQQRLQQRQQQEQQQRTAHMRERARLAERAKSVYATATAAPSAAAEAKAAAPATKNASAVSAATYSRVRLVGRRRVKGNAIGNVEHSKHVVKSVVVQPAAAPVSAAVATNNQVGQYPTQPNQYQTKSNVEIHGGLLGSVLNIPIGVLRSLQDSIKALDINKSVTYTHN